MQDIELVINQINKLHIYNEVLNEIKDELEDFLKNTNMDTIEFANSVMFNEEIKANNLIEGYADDIESIDDIVKTNLKNQTAKNNKEQRILNLYNGYKYILKNPQIDKANLKKLYYILSKNLLSDYDLSHMGEYYRNEPVYIFYSDSPYVEPDQGINFNEIDNYMNNLFEYINHNNKFDTKTDFYIKSQIIHFYFVYIHPYFDVNGRTSRTISMWYLLNNEIYPYIIFNRGINFSKNIYYKNIRNTIKYSDITIFLKYMLETVKVELEKEYLIINIESLTQKLSDLEKQTLNYILSMKSDINLKTFSAFYRRFNELKKLKEINQSLLEPLFDKKILLKTGYTSSKIPYNGENNFKFEINRNYLDNDPKKIKRLKLQ